jgi:glycosyltransferase involved in cell wall biosynthesis
MALPSIVTIAVPSYNQGRFLEDALNSIFEQNLPVEVFVTDAGSTDQSVDIIKKFEGRLSG